MYEDTVQILGLLIIALMNTFGPIIWLREIKEWEPHRSGKVPRWLLIVIGTFVVVSAIAAAFLGYAFALSLIF